MFVPFYSPGHYKNISGCVDIAARVCDLTREIGDAFESHWLQVKAVVGTQQSEYVETSEFILQKHGKFHHKLNLFPKFKVLSNYQVLPCCFVLFGSIIKS